MFWTIPTLMTWTRIVAIPLIVGVFYAPLDPATRNLIATVMFVVFAATDTIRQSRTVGLAGCEPLCDEVHFTIPGDLEPGGFFVHLKLLSLVGEPLVNVGQIAIQ